MGFYSGFISEVFDPDEPFEEDDDVEEWPEDPVVSEMPGFRIVYENNGKDDDSQDIYSMHNEDRSRDIPKFVFPWAGEEQKQDGDLEKLFESGTGGVDGEDSGIRDAG